MASNTLLLLDIMLIKQVTIISSITVGIQSLLNTGDRGLVFFLERVTSQRLTIRDRYTYKINNEILGVCKVSSFISQVGFVGNF